MKQWILNGLAATAMLVATAATVFAGDTGKPLNNLNKNGLLVDGYDVVAYFTDGKPVKGVASFSSTLDGATYWFASPEHKAAFDADPAKYAPQFGGFCAYAVSRGGLRPIDPAVFHFVDGKLFLQHTKKAYDLFEKDERGNTQRAYKKWPKLVAKKADKFVPGQFDEPVR